MLKKEEKSYHHGDLRDALLEAVRTLVERDGVDSFKVAEACRIAGVSTAAPYKHFRDRGDILRGVARLAMDRLGARMAEAAASHPPGREERIAALGRAYVHFARDEPGIFRLIFGQTEGHAGDPELEAQGERAIGIVERVVADHLDLPTDAEEVRARAYALWCFVHGHCFLTLDDKLAHHEQPVPEERLLTLVGRAMLPPRAERAGSQGS